ncbi:hypothetical protein RCG23_12790 [Neobacillus sp. PS3-34]|uniref:hypothetical protein n=1 Tax=Neobacillus sp. PS3-34 TaxID=3070678 RepID=UPI0027DF2B33|nr:hypothetical protein [Neobacillus sp. PS3-34]WML46551.1 hypothetical protein RCG23_12790 [Neobacillus sp. PS3-34]
MKKWMIVILALYLAGCSNNNNANYDLKKDKTNPQFMSNRPDGRQRMGDQNPNFLNLKGTTERSEINSNQETDVDQARRTVAMSKEFTPGAVWINGDRMWVTVYKKGMLTEREKINAEARMHRKLVHALPRYNIEVRVKEDRR